ncbi:hypothetical protein [Adhaeretor mobilis]|nr:hypothetical protein [Adhaeretor mobilis]
MPHPAAKSNTSPAVSKTCQQPPSAKEDIRYIFSSPTTTGTKGTHHDKS